MTKQRYYRKVIHIKAEDSPNVRWALAELRMGRRLTGATVIPGVLSYKEYLKRRTMWDPIRQCIGLDGRFWKGKEALLYPPDWLDRAGKVARALRNKSRQAKGIGIDPAEGGDKTSMAAVDEVGLIELVAKKTPNTAVIPKEVIAFGRKHRVPPEAWVFDRGGGGKQHADTLRAIELHDGTRPYEGVRTVGFGESISLTPRRGLVLIEERRQSLEEKYAYEKRRAQLYGELSILLEPDEFGNCFAVPDEDDGPEYAELRRQMGPIPKLYDSEGRLRMLPKEKRNPTSNERTLKDLLGCSPDELDSVALAVHAMLHEVFAPTAGAIV